ncbi:uncharacterized protein At4g15970 isoform X2 [Coffea arabica]|uniref:Uncharacterized protein At4g15970 isoform X2 n=1 Tax=Coffea arabica TaxID=13443 RepID=A0ABM4UXP2_COFAR
MLIYIYGEAACTNPGFPKRHQYYFVMIDAEGRKAGKREDKMSKDGGCHHLCHHLLYQNQVVIWLILLVVAADLSLVLYRSAFSNNPSSQHFTFGQENDSSSSSQDGDSKVEGDLSFQKSTSPGDTSAPSLSSSAQSSNGNRSSPTESVQGNLSPQVNQENEETKLERVLSKAASADKTIIFTTINEAWITPGSLFDLFLEGFNIGNQTQYLLNHLVIVAMDQKAYSHCLGVHHHCYALITEGVDFSGRANYMSPQYMKMMWRRLDFMRTILELGYSFIFTDTDIIWFRDPFPHFYEDADFQIASDQYEFTSTDMRNRPNAGFMYVRSNSITLQFYKFWCGSKKTYPGKNEQDVLNIIKFDPFIKRIGLKIRFLDTAYFSGFCQPSKDLNVLCTMHANCCVDVHKKIHDLRLVIDDWKKYMALPSNRKKRYSWTQRKYCV